MVVEENLSDRRFLCKILQKKSFKTVIADESNVREKIESSNFNLIIIGSILKRGNLDLCIDLKSFSSNCHIPVLVITEKDSGSNIVEYYMQNVDYCLVKPISEKELISQVRLLLRK